MFPSLALHQLPLSSLACQQSGAVLGPTSVLLYSASAGCSTPCAAVSLGFAGVRWKLFWQGSGQHAAAVPCTHRPFLIRRPQGAVARSLGGHLYSDCPSPLQAMAPLRVARRRPALRMRRLAMYFGALVLCSAALVVVGAERDLISEWASTCLRPISCLRQHAAARLVSLSACTWSQTGMAAATAMAVRNEAVPPSVQGGGGITALATTTAAARAVARLQGRQAPVAEPSGRRPAAGRRWSQSNGVRKC